jgi:hypothetical protein
MNRIAWIVFAAMLGLLVALSVKKYALPAPAGGGEASPVTTPRPGAGPGWPAKAAGPAVPPPKVRPPLFAPVPVTPARILGAREQEETKALQKLRDRMELERHLTGDPTPRVETIVATGDNRFSALIGDALVPEGGTVRGYRVRQITADSVEFEKDGKTWVQKVD